MRPTARAGVLLALLLTLEACGGGANTSLAYDTIHVAAHAVDAVDEANAAAMAATRQRDVNEASSREDALRRRAPYWRVEEALRGARALLFAAEASVDAVGADGLLELAPCVLEALARLKEAVTVLVETTHVDVDIPPQIDSVLRALSAYAGVCPSPGGAS